MIYKCGKKKSRKYLAVLAILVMMTFVASSAFALYDAPNKILHTYNKANTSGTAKQETAVSTSTIVPAYCRVIGFSCMPYDTTKNSELWIGLYDDATNAATSTDIIDEAAWGATNDRAPRWYPYPKELTDGLVVLQGMNTNVTIYYEDIREF